MLTVFVNINSADLIKTSVLAAIGAIVSYGVTLFLKVFLKRIKKSYFVCGDRSKKMKPPP